MQNLTKLLGILVVVILFFVALTSETLFEAIVLMGIGLILIELWKL